MDNKFPYASVDEYQALYGEPVDVDVLTEALLDASRLIRAECKRAGVDPAETPDEAMQVCRSVASRSMARLDSELPYGVSQYSEAVIGNSQSYTLSNPFGVPRLMSEERMLLGLDRRRIQFIPPRIDCNEEL